MQNFADNLIKSLAHLAAATFEYDTDTPPQKIDLDNFSDQNSAHEWRVNAAIEYQRQQGRNSATAPQPPSDISQEFAEVMPNINSEIN